MGFAEPIAWMFASLALVLVYLFLRPARRAPRLVPGIFLWPVAAPRRRARWDPLFFVQLLALLSLVMALAGPYRARLGASGPQRHVLVLDRTASMQARHAATTRFDAAKAEAEGYLSSVKPGDEVAVVAVGEQAELVVPFSKDLDQVRQALVGLQPYDSGGSLALGLSLAQTLAQGSEPKGRVVVFSDFAETELPEALLADATLFPVGKGDDNIGIDLFEVTQQALSTGGPAEVTVRVRNFGSSVKHGLLLLEWEGQALLHKGFTLGPEETEAVVQRLPGGGFVAARVEASDLLATDNEVAAFVPRIEPLRVCLISAQGSQWPELQALGAAGNIRVDTRGCASANGNAEVYVFHRARPPENFSYPALVMDPPARSLARPERMFREVPIVAWNKNHPIFSGWMPAFSLPLQRLRAIEVPDNATPLLWAEARGGPVAAAWSAESPVRQVWLGFDAVREPLLTSEGFSLAVFVLQSLAWLRATEPVISFWLVGHPYPVPVGSPTTVRLPTGEELLLPAGTSSFVPHWRGRYEFRGPNGHTFYHAVAIDSRESKIAPQLAVASRASAELADKGVEQRIPWGNAVLTGALLLLLFEAFLAGRLGRERSA